MSIEELVLRTLAKRGVAKVRVLSENERKITRLGPLNGATQ